MFNTTKSFLFLTKRRSFYARLKKKKKKTLFIFLYSKNRHNILYSKRFFLNNANNLDLSKIDANILFFKKNFAIENTNNLKKSKNKNYSFTLFNGLPANMLDIKDFFYYNNGLNTYFTSIQLNNNFAGILHKKQLTALSNWYNFDFTTNFLNNSNYFFIQKLNNMAEEESNFFLPEPKNSYFFLYNNIDLVNNTIKSKSLLSNNSNGYIEKNKNLKFNKLNDLNSFTFYNKLDNYLYFFFNNFFYKLNCYLGIFYSDYFNNLFIFKIINYNFIFFPKIFFIKRNLQINFLVKHLTFNFFKRIYTFMVANFHLKYGVDNLFFSFNKWLCKPLFIKNFKNCKLKSLSFLYYTKILRNIYMHFSKSFFTFNYHTTKSISSFFLQDIVTYNKIKKHLIFKKLKFFYKLKKKKGLKLNDYTIPASLSNSNFFNQKFYWLNIFNQKKKVLLFLTFNFKLENYFKKWNFKYIYENKFSFISHKSFIAALSSYNKYNDFHKFNKFTKFKFINVSQYFNRKFAKNNPLNNLLHIYRYITYKTLSYDRKVAFNHFLFDAFKKNKLNNLFFFNNFVLEIYRKFKHSYFFFNKYNRLKYYKQVSAHLNALIPNKNPHKKFIWPELNLSPLGDAAANKIEYKYASDSDNESVLSDEKIYSSFEDIPLNYENDFDNIESVLSNKVSDIINNNANIINNITKSFSASAKVPIVSTLEKLAMINMRHFSNIYCKSLFIKNIKIYYINFHFNNRNISISIFKKIIENLNKLNKRNIFRTYNMKMGKDIILDFTFFEDKISNFFDNKKNKMDYLALILNLRTNRNLNLIFKNIFKFNYYRKKLKFFLFKLNLSKIFNLNDKNILKFNSFFDSNIITNFKKDIYNHWFTSLNYKYDAKTIFFCCKYKNFLNTFNKSTASSKIKKFFQKTYNFIFSDDVHYYNKNFFWKLHKFWYKKKYTISNFIRKKIGIKFIFLKNIIIRKKNKYFYYNSSDFFLDHLEDCIRFRQLEAFLDDFGGIEGFGFYYLYFPFNPNFIFHNCSDEFFDEGSESFLRNNMLFRKFIKNKNKKNFNNLDRNNKKSFLNMYLLKEFKISNSNINASNNIKLFNLENKKNSLIKIQKRLILLKKQKGNLYYGLPEVFNYASILLFNNIDSLTTVVPIFYFVSVLYNWYYWFYFYNSFMPNTHFKYLCKDNYLSHVSLKKHNWYLRNKNNIKYKYKLCLLNLKNKLLFFLMYEHLFFNAIFNKNNLLKFHFLKNSNIFFFNIFEFFIIETFHDFDVFSAYTDNNCFVRLCTVSSKLKRDFFFANHLNINFYNFFNVNNNFKFKILNDFSFYFLNIKVFKNLLKNNLIVKRKTYLNNFFFNTKLFFYVYNFFSFNFHYIYLFKRIYLFILKNLILNDLLFTKIKQNYKYFILLAELNYILINYYLILLNFLSFMLKYLKI